MSWGERNPATFPRRYEDLEGIMKAAEAIRAIRARAIRAIRAISFVELRLYSFCMIFFGAFLKTFAFQHVTKSRTV